MKNKLNFALFTGDVLFAFVRALLKIINSTLVTDGLISKLVIKVETVFTNYSKGIEFDSKDPLTILASEYNSNRDQYFNGMKNYIHSFLNSPDKAKAQAAEKLVALIKKYGWRAAELNYEAETTAIVKIVEEMELNYAAEVETLMIKALWVDPLMNAQNSFEEVQKQRVQKGSIEVPTISRYRRPLILAVRKLIDTLETVAENSDDETLNGYVRDIDELIGVTMAPLKSNATRSNNNNSVGGEADANSPAAPEK